MSTWECSLGSVSATPWGTERQPDAEELRVAASPTGYLPAEKNFGPAPEPGPCPVEPLGFACPMGIWWNAAQEEYLPELLVADWLPDLQRGGLVEREALAAFHAWIDHERVLRRLQEAYGDARATQRILIAMFAAVEEIRSWH